MYDLKCCKTSKKFRFAKKIIPFFAVLLISASALSGCGKPNASPIEDFSYEFEDGNVTITGYTGTDREIIIPDVIDERPVTVIGKKAFQGYDLTSITIPETVTTIKSNAFNDCKLLENINLNGELQSCSKETLQYTKWYENQEEGVVYLGSTAIGYKGSLPSEIIIKDGTKSITDYAFKSYSDAYGYYNGNFLSIHIPESVNYIGEYSIGYYYSVKSDSNCRIDNFKIYGKSGSEAETYANKTDTVNKADKPFTFISE